MARTKLSARKTTKYDPKGMKALAQKGLAGKSPAGKAPKKPATEKPLPRPQGQKGLLKQLKEEPQAVQARGPATKKPKAPKTRLAVDKPRFKRKAKAGVVALRFAQPFLVPVSAETLS